MLIREIDAEQKERIIRKMDFMVAKQDLLGSKKLLRNGLNSENVLYKLVKGNKFAMNFDDGMGGNYNNMIITDNPDFIKPFKLIAFNNSETDKAILEQFVFNRADI